MDQKQKEQLPISTNMPIRIDMTIGDESARLVKVKHQGVEETVRVMNRVLRKINANVQIEIVRSVAPPTEFSDPELDGRFLLTDSSVEETASVGHI